MPDTGDTGDTGAEQGDVFIDPDLSKTERSTFSFLAQLVHQ